MKIGRMSAKVPKASRKPTVRDLEWAAGFLDGEGCFRRHRSASHWQGTEQVTAQQNAPELLERLQSLFGGKVGKTKSTSPNGTKREIWQWHIYGARARGVMMTLYLLMSEKRKVETKQALA